ncbi:MAG TPA: MarR family transcriptional regulator [Chitinophaga sp.]|uniref:MarR family winged helix-turn-helix transcriptional regulator n=1 Tax=Chitinophaga sp. TaxID=1869181 RepID=UPI002C57B8C5|nr:MarR family transcriptional regulator [Chitinophaga sp.]HVI45670.1 MarR family transcriptional regulator [Chitinophaga sp.]
MNNSPRVSLLLSQALGLYRLRINALLIQHNIDLTSEMCTVLRILWKKEGRKQQELADILCKDKGSITKIIDNLEKRELVERVTDAEDARNKNIVLTAQGKAMKKKVVPLLDGFLDSVIDHASQADLEATRRVLTGIIQKLK